MAGVVRSALAFQSARFKAGEGQVLVDTTLLAGPTIPSPEWLRRELRTLAPRFVPTSRTQIEECTRKSSTCLVVRVTGLRSFEGAVHVSALWTSSSSAGCSHSYSGTVLLRPSVGIWEVVGTADEEHGSCGARSRP